MARTVAANRASQRAFTLIEITFAVLILASSIATLMGLQYATLQREYRDVNMQRAMLVARRVLARLEIEEVPLDTQKKRMSVPDLLDEYAPEDIAKDGTNAPGQSFADMDAEFVVESWPVPGSENPDALRRLSLRIIWGPSELDVFETMYFVPGESARKPSGGSNDETG